MYKCQQSRISPDELPSLLAEYQAILRLQDWDFIVRLKRGFDLAEGVRGQFRATPELKRATINLLDPCDYSPDTVVPYDMEQTLVHELLHAHFDPFFPDNAPDPLRISMEQAIERLSQAIVFLKRRSAIPVHAAAQSAG